MKWHLRNDLTPELRIVLLKVVIGGCVTSMIGSFYYIKQLEKSLKQSRKLRKIQSKIVEQLVQGVNDPELLKKVMEQYEFDWIVFQNRLDEEE